MWSKKCWIERDNLFGLVAMVLFRQPRSLLAVFAAKTRRWLVFSLLSTKIPRSLPAELLPSWSVLSLYCCKGFFLPRGKTLPWSFWSFIRFLLDPSSSLFRSLWMAVQHLSVFIGSLQFGISNVLLKQYQKILVYILTLIVALIRIEWENRTSMFQGTGLNKSCIYYKKSVLMWII